MPKSVFLGEFEQLVLLAILELGDDAHVLPLRNRLEEIAGRRVSRGALYRTLDRLEHKGYLTWAVEPEAPARGGHPRRFFSVTAEGRAVLRAARDVLQELWDGVKGRL